MKLLSGLELLQIKIDNASKSCVRSIDFLGQLASKSGAKVYVDESFPNDPTSFHGRGKELLKGINPYEWASQPNRILLIANTEESIGALETSNDISAVHINMAPWHSEATLFASSGLASILGDPNREPLFPVGNFSSSTIAYAAFSGLAALWCKMKLKGAHDIAKVDGISALAWANWKSIAAGHMGNNLKREGVQAEWPALQCKDGHVALIYHVGIWDNVVNMIDDEVLKSDKYDTFEKRAKDRSGYMSIIRDWCRDKTKDELKDLFYEHGVPGAPINSFKDILEDPLFNHRKAFEPVDNGGQNILSPRAPHRVVEIAPSPEAQKNSTSAPSDLPLKGVRVLDLGIITAGAGSSAILADMGAEVLKIESKTYADPFRRWAGSSDSPLFKFNNRNKYGVEANLKSDEGRARFVELVKNADVVVENFKRGVLDRIGFSFEKLKAINPTIVLASISGQGLDGPQSDGPTFGSTLEANAGFSAMSSYSDGVPYVTGRNGNYPDQTVCLYAGAAIALAVQKSRSENSAVRIDVSQRDVAMYMAGDIVELASVKNDITKDEVRESLKEHEVNHFFKSKDDKWVCVSAESLSAFHGVDGLNSADSIADVAAWVAHHDADGVETVLRQKGIGAAMELNGEQVYKLTDVKKHDAFLTSPQGIFVKGFPFQLKKTPMTVYAESPGVGEHTSQFV